jgi:copper chaperone CopZ
MEATKFKTNIKCSACVEKVTPYLNEVVGEGNWEVDLTNPSRTLTTSENENETEINNAIQKAGYKAENAKS